MTDLRPYGSDPAPVTAATRAACPGLVGMIDLHRSKRASSHRYVCVERAPEGLRAYVDYVFGTAPRAADKRRGRAACLRELAAAEASGALAELEAAYRGEGVA